MSVSSDDISRETLEIARYGLPARISRVVPFSLHRNPQNDAIEVRRSRGDRAASDISRARPARREP